MIETSRHRVFHDDKNCGVPQPWFRKEIRGDVRPNKLLILLRGQDRCIRGRIQFVGVVRCKPDHNSGKTPG